MASDPSARQPARPFRFPAGARRGFVDIRAHGRGDREALRAHIAALRTRMGELDDQLAQLRADREICTSALDTAEQLHQLRTVLSTGDLDP